MTEEDDALVEHRSFTETQISALQPCVVEQLVEADRVAHWAQEVRRSPLLSRRAVKEGCSTAAASHCCL
jgi:hypothetical protein